MADNIMPTTDNSLTQYTKAKRLNILSKTPLRVGASASDWISYDEAGSTCEGCGAPPPYVGAGVTQEYIDGYDQYAAIVNPYQSTNDWLLFDNAGLLYGANSDLTTIALIGVSPLNQINWTDIYYTSIAWTGFKWISRGNDYVSLIQSTDGKVWTELTPANYFGSLAVNRIAVDENSIIYVGSWGSLFKSTNLTGNAFNTIKLSSNIKGGLIARNNTVIWGTLDYGDDTNIYTSTNGGTTFTTIPNVGNFLSCIIWDGTQYVGGDAGAIQTSPDGITWTRTVTTGITGKITDIVYNSSSVDAKYVAIVANQNPSNWYSTNAINWTVAPTGQINSSAISYVVNTLHQNTLGIYALRNITIPDMRISRDGKNWALLPNPVNGNTFVAGFPRVFDPTRAHL